MNQIDRHVDYDQVAPTYDGRYQHGGYTGTERSLLQFVGEELQLQILEVGCGTGHWLGMLNARSRQVIGLDFSLQMLVQARTSLPGVRLIRGRAERLPLTDASVDRVFCVNAFHHFIDKPAFLAEARRILRTGGKLFIIGFDPHPGTDQWYVYDYFEETRAIDKERFPPTSVLRQWMENAGFENCFTQEVETWVMRMPARELLAQGRVEKAATSQLTVLTDEEFRRGFQRLQEDIERLEAKGETLFLAANMRLYGTGGSVTSPNPTMEA